MISQLVPLTLENLGGGGAMELFARELQKVLENCRDPNTNPSTKRKVTLELIVAPEEDRESAAIAVKISSRLVAPRGIAQRIFIGESEGKLVAVTYDPKQKDLFQEVQVSPPAAEDGVTPIKQARSAS